MTTLILTLSKTDEALLNQVVTRLNTSIEQFALSSLRQAALTHLHPEDPSEPSLAELITAYPKPTSFNADEAVDLQRAWRDEW